ncbi:MULTISPECIES: hypothetical protein [Sphingomonadaceae]|uniref:hypothetical protein n=1 Tax=Sphingomonadales TaxID=204457 RepID=UPI0007701119|nr:hypothetical protein [Sphingobium sp. TKS]AMK23262.1 hypothetical protein K426_11630 [Sphingobium sp. TKS]MCF8709061.1 hypothetical protein [Rhizorhapis sp. SPR117]
MLIYVTSGRHFAHPSILRRHFGTFRAAREAAAEMVNLLRDSIDRDRLPPVPTDGWQQGLHEAQRERLLQESHDPGSLASEDLAAKADCNVWIERAHVEDPISFPVVDDRELGALLAALRLLQQQGCPEELLDVATDGAAFRTIDTSEIDALCERLNAAGTSTEIPRIVVALEGGLVSGVVTNRPVILHTVDYETEGADDDDITLVPQDDHDPVEAIVNQWAGDALTLDPDWIARLEAAIADTSEA